MGPEPAACARVVAQPKQFALLTYLAARPSGERVSRERILATFWPEMEPGRAHGSLRTAVHRLRQLLGPEIISGNAQQVGIPAECLACDARTLLDRDLPAAPEELLDLYRGEFLDGFSLLGAPDFERWVDRTRAVLRSRGTELAWTLSGRAEAAGHWISAAQYARRAAELAVDIEGATQRLIRLLDRAGDRAAAVAEYERLARTLGRDYGLVPSPETTALIGRVRERQSGEQPPHPRVVLASPRPRSLAVMPFEDVGASPAPLLARGVTEDLLTALARIRDIRVVSRTSVRRFEGRPPPPMQAVRELLDVDLVIEGSVDAADERCRITVQLIDARQDRPLWAESYDRSLSNLVEIQSDVTLRVTRALAVELSPREHRQLRRPRTVSLKAWQLYLRGREAFSRRSSRELDRAVAHFQQALQVDDGFAQAWVGLADAHLALAGFGGRPVVHAAQEAKRAVQQALARDPDSGEARATRGLIKTFIEPDPPAAELEYRRALDRSPGYAPAHMWYGNWLCIYGEPDHGLAELSTATDLDPLSPVVSHSTGLALLHLGRWTDAEAMFHQTLELDPGFWRTRFALGVCHAKRADWDGASSELLEVWNAGGWGTEQRDAADVRLLQLTGRSAVEYLNRALRSQRRSESVRVPEIVLQMLLGRYDEALDAIVAGEGKSWPGFLLLYCPLLDPLRVQQRFREGMSRMGLLLPRWRKSA
jgi:TolB-like protein/Tfp pilus assembly protein PilF